jgi:membrane protease YdiL (CAAX protease family)
MSSEPGQPAPAAPQHVVPWKSVDNWIGVALLAIVDVGLFLITLRGSTAEFAQSATVILLELAYLLPVILIFAWRRVHWKHLGFGGFDRSVLGIGCGLLVASYAVIVVHNAILFLLGVDTQGEAIMKLFSELDAPVWFLIVGVLFAPLVEEIFFRGFLFQGFRARYGWVPAMLLSGFIFAVAHLDLVVLIPTFVLGCLLAYVYHRSNSLWPGIILHFLVNSFGLCGAYFASNYQNLIPA